MGTTRRGFLGAGMALASLPRAIAANQIGRSRISAITDEIALTAEGAIEFAHKYGLEWLELRVRPGVRGTPRPEYFQMPVADLKQAARQFKDAGIRISFLNTSMLKYLMPGTTPANPRWKASDRYEGRMDELNKALEAADILGVRKVRVFTFMRVTEPRELFPRIAEDLMRHAEVAGRAKVTLLVENEGSCNVATGAELVAMLKLAPSKWLGINWDPLNAARGKEIVFPDGYETLPAKKIGNVQIKGKSILDFPERMDWAAIFRRLEKDGYQGQVGLETHIFDEKLIEWSHKSMQEIIRITGEPRS